MKISLPTVIIFCGLSSALTFVIYERTGLSKEVNTIMSERSLLDKEVDKSNFQKSLEENESIASAVGQPNPPIKPKSDDVLPAQAQENRQISHSADIASTQHSTEYEISPHHFENHILVLEEQILAEEYSEDWLPEHSQDVEIFLNTLNEAYNHALIEASSYCGTTICKSIFTLPNTYGESEVVDEFVSSLNWETKTFSASTINQDGSISSVVYFSREGYDLPEMEIN